MNRICIVFALDRRMNGVQFTQNKTNYVLLTREV